MARTKYKSTAIYKMVSSQFIELIRKPEGIQKKHILELDNVVYDKVQALYLIGSNSIIDGTGKVNSVSTFLCDLVFVNDWIQFIEVLVIAVI